MGVAPAVIEATDVPAVGVLAPWAHDEQRHVLDQRRRLTVRALISIRVVLLGWWQETTGLDDAVKAVSSAGKPLHLARGIAVDPNADRRRREWGAQLDSRNVEVGAAAHREVRELRVIRAVYAVYDDRLHTRWCSSQEGEYAQERVGPDGLVHPCTVPLLLSRPAAAAAQALAAAIYILYILMVLIVL